MTTAQPTPGASGLITAAHQSGRTVTIVSNNSGHAISQYLAVHDLPAHVIGIIVAEGEQWTGMAFPESDQYVVPDALHLVDISREKDRGTYAATNLWMRHL